MKLFYSFVKTTLCCVTALVMNAATQAQTITYVTPAGAGDFSGSSWSNAAPGTQLQRAIDAAAAGSQVWVAAGTYKPTTGTDRNVSFSMKEAVGIYGGFKGNETTLAGRPAITFAQPSGSILSGDIGNPNDNSDNSYHIISNMQNGLTATAVLNGFVLTGGNGNAAITGGGAMYNYMSSPSVRYCAFVDNQGDGYGAVVNESNDVDFQNCSFVNNRGVSNISYGGALTMDYCNSVNITNCVFWKNYAASAGAVFFNGSTSSNIFNCTFVDNDYYYKSGVVMFSFSGDQNKIANCIFQNPGKEDAYASASNFSLTSSVADETAYNGTGGNIVTDPLFVNKSAGDFHLRNTSPALNAGNDTLNTSTTDLDGKPRRYGVIDMGAYEYQADFCVPPSISSQPQSVTTCGGAITLGLSASGSNLVYKWYHNGQAISNNSPTLTIPKATAADAGSYAVDVTNDCGIASSNVVSITVFANSNGTVYVDSSASVSGSGASWASPFQHLQDALNSAKNCSNINTILVAKGTYMPASGTARDSAFAIVRGGLKIYGGYPSGGGTRNVLANRTVLSGDIGVRGDNSDNTYNVLVIAGLSAADDSVVVDGLTITKGNASGGVNTVIGDQLIYQGNGGGVFLMNNANGHRIALRNLVISDNSAANVGGGVEINHASPLLASCVITNNTSTGAGAALFDEQSAAPLLTNCLFTYNKAGWETVMNNSSSTPQLVNCTFYANPGTAINNDASAAVVTNSILWGNGTGPAITGDSSSSTVTHSDVQGGYAGAGNINTDPSFANTAAQAGADGIFGTADDGLQLSCSSPLIDKGSANALSGTTDFAGNSRTQHTAPDMGAYESPYATPAVSSVSIKANPGDTVCAKTLTTFTAIPVNGGTSPVYQWQKNGEAVGGDSARYSTSDLNDSDVITVQLISNGTCISAQPASDTVVVRVNPLPQIPTLSVLGLEKFCPGGTLTLSAREGYASYRWSTGDTGRSIVVGDSGSYHVTVMNAAGCASMSLSYSPKPKAAPPTPAVTVADNCGSSVISTTARGGLLWSTGDTTSSITVSTAGTYTLVQTVGACSSTSASATAAPKVVPANPIITASGPATFSTGGSVTLSAPSGFSSYVWSNGATSRTIAVTASGSFTVVVSNGSCSSAASDSVAVTVQPAAATISLSYMDGDYLLVRNNAVRPYLQLNNDGASAVPYKDLTIRYWLTVEDFAPMSNLAIDWAQLGTSKVKIRYVKSGQPRQGAYGYLEYSFDASAGSLAAKKNSGPIQSRASKSDWTNFDESDDYSHAPYLLYARNNRITVYQSGKLVWGTEPKTVTPVQQLKSYSMDRSLPLTNTLSTWLNFSNEGNVPVSYGDITVRYWFTADGNKQLNYYLDYAQLGNSKIKYKFAKLASPSSTADTYLELSFTAADSLYPSSSTGNIQQRIAKSDWSNFNQLNDYSYRCNLLMMENARITVYVKGKLAYGQEPVKMQSAMNAFLDESFSDGALNIRLLSNPVTTSEIKFEVEAPQDQRVQAVLTDLRGTVIARKEFTQTGARSLQTLPAGAIAQSAVFLKVSTQTESKTVKVLIAK